MLICVCVFVDYLETKSVNGLLNHAYLWVVGLDFTRNELVRDVDRSWGKYLPVRTDFPAEKSHYKQPNFLSDCILLTYCARQ